MYVIDYDAFIQQALPPHWRGQWQHHLIDALCHPLKQVFEDIHTLRAQAIDELNHNSQTESLQDKIKAYHQKIEIGAVSRNGTIKILAPSDEQVRTQVENHLKKVKTAGKNIEFQNN